MLTYVYRKRDGVFLFGAPSIGDPAFDAATEGLARLDHHPDPVRDRFDPETRTARRATGEELAAAQHTTLDSKLDDALATGTVIIAAVFAHLPAIVAKIQAGTLDAVAQATAVNDVKATAKALLMQQSAGAGE